jgi:hypothetical protein
MLSREASTVKSASAPADIMYTPYANCERPETVIAVAKRNNKIEAPIAARGDAYAKQ